MINNKEELFIKTFRLAKEKGYFIREMLIFEPFQNVNYLENIRQNARFIELCLLQKWLREKHNIHIEITKEIDFSDEKYGDRFEYIIVRSLFSQDISNIKYFDSYELALEQALFECLNLIN
jgi:hypothetical protein